MVSIGRRTLSQASSPSPNVSPSPFRFPLSQSSGAVPASPAQERRRTLHFACKSETRYQCLWVVRKADARGERRYGLRLSVSVLARPCVRECDGCHYGERESGREE